MLDLETLGTSPGCVIASIGAAKIKRGMVVDTFYRTIEMQTCIGVGMTIDIETVCWWMKQADAARMEITEQGCPIAVGLMQFAGWINCSCVCVWGDGVSFDNAILSRAYELCRIEKPWHFTNDRCYRTLKAIHSDVLFATSGIKHNALDDAKSQALHLIEIDARKYQGALLR